VEEFAEDVGFDVDETVESNNAVTKAAAEAPKFANIVVEPASVDGQLMRFAGGTVGVTADGRPCDEDEDPISRRKLNVELIVVKTGWMYTKTKPDAFGQDWRHIGSSVASLTEQSHVRGGHRERFDDQRFHPDIRRLCRV